MARVNVVGFESGLALPSEITVVGGASAVASSPTRGAWSLYSCKILPSSTTATRTDKIRALTSSGGQGNASAATSYINIAFYITTAPGSGAEPVICVMSNSDVLVKIEFRLTSSRTLDIYTGTTGATLLASGTTVLSLNTWYDIQITCGTGASAAYELKINGTTEYSGNAAVGTANASGILLGKRVNRSSQSIEVYFDDVIWDDAAYADRASQVGLLKANSAGNYQTWTRGGTDSGNNWDQVDEVPLSEADYLVSPTVDGDAETEGMQPASSLSISGTINSVKAMIGVLRDGGTNGNIKMRTRSGSTDTDLVAAQPSSAGAIWGKIHETDPATSASWTTGGIDGFEVGAVEGPGVNKSRMTWAATQVEWVPGGGGGGQAPRSMHQFRQRGAS